MSRSSPALLVSTLVLVGILLELVTFNIAVAIEPTATSCPLNATQTPNGPSIVDFFKVGGALVAITSGLIASIVPDQSKRLRYLMAVLVVLGTGLSFVIDRTQAKEDDNARALLMTCVQQVAKEAAILHQQGVDAREAQRALLKQQTKTLDTTTTNVALSQKGLVGIGKALHNTDVITQRADGILTQVDDTAYPFNNIRYSWEMRLNLRAPGLANYRGILQRAARKFITPGDYAFNRTLLRGATSVRILSTPSTYLQFAGGENLSLRIDFGSPLMPSDGKALISALGDDLRVDIFKHQPDTATLRDINAASSDYDAFEATPFIADTRTLDASNGGFPKDSFRVYQLVYYPANETCFVEFYMGAPKRDDTAAPKIAGLPDLRGTDLVLRVRANGEELSQFRIRIDSQEMLLAAKDFTRMYSPRGYHFAADPSFYGNLLTYVYRFPTTVPNLLSVFSTISSNADGPTPDMTLVPHPL